jgi:hypothetical protein
LRFVLGEGVGSRRRRLYEGENQAMEIIVEFKAVPGLIDVYRPGLIGRFIQGIHRAT